MKSQIENFYISRRGFLKSTAALTAMAALPSLGADAVDVLNKPRRVALIGAGWYGKSDLWRLIQVAPVDVVAICDVDQHQLAGALEIASQRQKSKKTPLGYSDYRKLLKEQQLDIVLVGTPDHWHALTAIAAMEAGADVYCQKPISRDVREGEAMLDAARRLKRVVQIGTAAQEHRRTFDRSEKQIVESGMLGKIGHVELCCYLHMRANGRSAGLPVQPVPDFLDYEMWSGPAVLRPYDGLPHMRWWRTFMEYGNGIVGDMCVHMLDTARWMLGLKWPTRISSEGGIYVQKGGKSDISDTQVAVFEYPDFNCVWNHRTWGAPPDPDYAWSLIIYGEKGTLKAKFARCAQTSFRHGQEGKKLDPFSGIACTSAEQYPEDVTEKQIELNAAPATRKHMIDFLAAIDTRGRPVADIEEGHISTASCIMANLSMKAGRPFVYNPVKRVVVGDHEATKMLRADYRSPWKHPEGNKTA